LGQVSTSGVYAAGGCRRLIRASREGRWPTLAVFEHAEEYRAVYKAMVGKRGADVVKRYQHRLLSELMLDHLSANAPSGQTRVPLEVVVEFAVSGILGLLTWWLDSDLPCSPEEMDELCRRLAEPGIRSGLRPGG